MSICCWQTTTYLFLVEIKNVVFCSLHGRGGQTSLNVVLQLSKLSDEVERGLGGDKPLVEAEQGVGLGTVDGRGHVWQVDDPRADRGGGRFTEMY